MGIFDLFRRKPSAGEGASSSQNGGANGGPPSGDLANDRGAWQAALLAFVRERHAASPAKSESELDPLELAQFRAEGGFLRSWLTTFGPRMLGERKMLLEGMGRASAGPLVVVHGDGPAVSAVLHVAGEHAKTGEKRLVALLDEDYDAFIARHREAREFDFHVSSWSRFIPAGNALLERAREMGKPIDPALTYFNHVNGTLWGPQNGLEVENLWSWDGETLDLVEEAISHRRY